MNDYDKRLARLEGRFLEAEGIRKQLYEDYLELSEALRAAEVELAEQRRLEIDAARTLKNAKENYDALEKTLLATNEGAGGKNDTERKRNADYLIVKERNQGGYLHKVFSDMNLADDVLQATQTQTQILADHFSAVRYAMRALAGVAGMLG